MRWRMRVSTRDVIFVIRSVTITGVQIFCVVPGLID